MKLKNILIPFLLCSLLFFIPKTHASIFEYERINGSVYSATAPYEQLRTYNEVRYMQTGENEFGDFESVYMQSDYSRTCDAQSFIYRIDYQLFGWHSATKTKAEWVRFAKLIQADKLSGVPNSVEVLGSTLSFETLDKINVSTFIRYTWASSSDCQTMNLSLILDFNDSPKDLYFYNPDFLYSNYYTIYNAAYEVSDINTAMQIINDYYETGSITNEKLDSIEQKLIDTNEKLDETNEKLDDIYDTMTDTSLNTGQLENSAGWLPAGPVDSILNLPLSLYENLLNVLQNGQTCPALQITLPFAHEVLSIPCLSDIFSKIDGLNVFWSWVGTISGAFLLFNYLIHLYKWVDDTLTFRENNHFGGY